MVCLVFMKFSHEEYSHNTEKHLFEALRARVFVAKQINIIYLLHLIAHNLQSQIKINTSICRSRLCALEIVSTFYFVMCAKYIVFHATF